MRGAFKMGKPLGGVAMIAVGLQTGKTIGSFVNGGRSPAAASRSVAHHVTRLPPAVHAGSRTTKVASSGSGSATRSTSSTGRKTVKRSGRSGPNNGDDPGRGLRTQTRIFHRQCHGPTSLQEKPHFAATPRVSSMIQRVTRVSETRLCWTESRYS